MEFIVNEKYNLVDTADKLRELDKILMSDDQPNFKVLAYDTETNGLHIHNNTVVGFSISYNSNSGYYIPLLVWERDPESNKTRKVDKVAYDCFMEGKLKCVWTGETFDEFVTPQEYNIRKRFPVIPALLERWLSKTNLIMHNAPFDVNMTLTSLGVNLKDNVFVDTALLLHILDENNPAALKKAAERYKHQLGINPHAQAAVEKQELDTSIIESGGKPGQVWRATLDYQSKYACADTFLTYGIFEAAMQEFSDKFGQEGLDWFFNKEVMPVCKEVVMDMKRRGFYVDVEYFKKIHSEVIEKMESLEDQFIGALEAEGLLEGFNVGQSVDDAVSNKALIIKIIELENRKIPTKTNKKTGEVKETLAKGEVKKVYQEDPHWIWGYILGEDEIKYSDDELAKIKRDLWSEKMNKGKSDIEPKKRYRFNVNSADHLRWLFCEKIPGAFSRSDLPQTKSATKDNPIPSMSADVLSEYMLPKWPWVQVLMSYKRLAKMESTYIRPALVLNQDGWLYMDMKQNGTTSGRFSCSGGYNLQTLPRVDDEMEILESCDQCHSDNIEVKQEIEAMADRVCKDCGHVKKDIPRPSAIKKGFIAPPGYKIVNADYSSLEPRCFAHMSNEQALKDVYLKGLDLYSQVYCAIFDHEGQYSADPKAPNFLKKVAKPKRTFIKPIVLGIPYGAEDAQVAHLIGAYVEKTNHKTGKVEKYLDIEEGKRVRDAFLGKLGNLKQYMDDRDLDAVTQGFVETIVGRRRHLPYAKKINDVLERHGVNYQSLRYASKNQLNSKTATFVDKFGCQVQLTEEMLEEIAKSLKIRSSKLKEKDYWVYVKNMLKADLNNAKNNPIQGLAGHITNKGMLDANRLFRQAQIDAWVALQVHDEITCYAKTEDAEKAAECLRQGMEQNEFAKMVDIPMIADPEICDNLKDAK